MSEIDREQILSQRLEEQERQENSKKLSEMVGKMQKGGESVSNAAKRQHVPRGATKEKDRMLKELKAKRLAKADKQTVRPLCTLALSTTNSPTAID